VQRVKKAVINWSSSDGDKAPGSSSHPFDNKPDTAIGGDHEIKDSIFQCTLNRLDEMRVSVNVFDFAFKVVRLMNTPVKD
jgi:hypothetical protein